MSSALDKPIAPALLLAGCLLGCAGAGLSGGDVYDPSAAHDDETSPEPEEDGMPSEQTPWGVVIVDVQETFISGAVNPDIDEVIARTGALLELADAHFLPTFITFEASDTGDHQLDPSLAPKVPAHAERFIKTTFDANGLAPFAAALEASGLEHFVVVGSETDVCVMQTVLGLRRAGYGVRLQQDAVFSSEPNVGPALRRMTQAGVTLVDEAAVSALAVEGATLDAPQTVSIPRARPGEVGILLNHLDADEVDAASDPWSAAKLARLRELLLISEWFDLPLYAADPGATLPSSLQGLLSSTIHPASEIDASTAQLVIAGTDRELAARVEAHHGARAVFLLEDALIATDGEAALRALLDERYDLGEVPLTYKSLYYEVTETVAFEDWPQAWIDRDAEYYERTVAPESLPPIEP
jgi:nicotinamidase-related amidase